MDRTTWLRKMRRESEQQYDTVWATRYGAKTTGVYANATHQQFVREFLGLLPKHSLLLDAACGAGRYEPMLLEGSHTVIGIDQSQGMLSAARVEYPQVHYEKVGLQEMSYQEVFDGMICMDAMEHICPEDWPLVLGNFHRALKQHGCLYFTAETIDTAEDENEIKLAFKRAREAGLPVVYGEWPDEIVYHYHPTNQQVRDWVQAIGFEILKEGDGDNYYHLIVRKTSSVKTAHSSENVRK